MSIIKKFSRFFSREIDPPHIFLHLHKCGGTTLMRCIDQNYRKKNVYIIDGSRYREAYDEFKMLDFSKREGIDLLRGHHFFGSHKYLREGALYFTMVREPMSRLASLYNYLREIDLYKDINSRDMSMAEFLDSGLAMAADNGMTRMLSGNDFTNIPNGSLENEVADQAIQKMEHHFAVIGITENFDESVKLFKSNLNWKQTPKYAIANKTEKRLISTQDVVSFLENNESYKKYISADLKVYEYAKNRFMKDLIDL